MNTKFILAVVASALVSLLVATGAAAHVTVQPTSVPADGFTRVDVRVPNEQDDAGTTKVSVKFPSGIYFASYEPVAGWKAAIKTKKLAEPVKMGDDETNTEVESVTFTATDDGIEPGQFQDFGLSISTPNKPNTSLTFPAVQTYSNGDVVRWIGTPDAEEPAPQLHLTAAVPEHGSAMASESDDEPKNDSDSSTIAWVALVVGGLGLLLGGGALVASRRRS
ncbi:MAG: YcnI family protein [Solirubrobacterales bacterium]